MHFPISSSIALLSLSSSIAAYAYPSMYSNEYNLAERDAYPSMYSDEYNLAERDAFAQPQPYEPAHQFYERDFDEDSLYERDLALQEHLYRRELAQLNARSELLERAEKAGKKCHVCNGELGCKKGGHIKKKNGKLLWASGACPPEEAAPAAE
ncbi:hypothetical protein MMC32_006304 [Xylographa parallela]|nr:hypothetical protein [Xylographa parallela]